MVIGLWSQLHLIVVSQSNYPGQKFIILLSNILRKERNYFINYQSLEKEGMCAFSTEYAIKRQ